MWEKMTIDEYAAFEKANGASLVHIDGTWWRRVRPFFYRPLIPFAEIAPHAVRYPPLHLIGGVQHGIPAGCAANSQLNYFIYDALQEYEFDKLPKQQRYLVRRGLKNFTIRSIVDHQEFIEQGYNCYLSFYSRTKYAYRSDRQQKHRFEHWAQTLFHYPQVLRLGAYRDDRLVGMLMSYRVDESIYCSTLTTDSEHYQFGISDALFHAVREQAAATDAQCIYMGPHTGIKGLDDYKWLRGCKLVVKPAYFRMNQAVLHLLRKYRSREYAKLLGMADIAGQNP